MGSVFSLIATFIVLPSTNGEVLRPFAEYEPVKYVVMSAQPYYTGATQAEIIRNLPEGVEVLLYSTDREDLTVAFEYWARRSPDKTIHYVYLPPGIKGDKGIAFWAMDSMPYPVWKQNAAKNGEAFALVNARYKHSFEPDNYLAEIFSAQTILAPNTTDFGNLMANEAGDCFLIERPVEKTIPDGFYTANLGCKRVVRLPWLEYTDRKGETQKWGIGHIDERIKFLSKDAVVIDSPEYKATLESLGYTNILLVPRMAPNDLGAHRTYINARLINKVAFVPVYDLLTDAEAIHVYEKQGFTVVRVPSADASDYGSGAIHCLTATYPALPPGIELNIYSH